MTTWISIALLVFAATVPADAATENGCQAFLLKEITDGVTVEGIPIAEGGTQIIPMGRDSGNTPLLLHVGPGMSGSVEQRSTPPLVVMAVARCINGALRVTYRQDDGTERAMPPVDVAEWAQYDMRVSVTGATGVRQAFRIRGGRTVEDAAGPVIDMFGGRVPMQPRDYAITTEVTQHDEIPTVAGSAPLLFDGAHFFVPVRLADGTEAEFVVDFGGGGRSVVSRAFLRDGLAVHEVVVVEYSEQGRRTVAASMQGLGWVATSISFAGRPPFLAYT